MLYKDKYHLKRLETKDLPAVKEILLKVYNKKVSLKYLQNKYNATYTGMDYICTIAYHGNNPVAFYGAIPQIFSSNKGEINVGHTCDSFTLKECQGQGLHYQLAKLSYELMKECNIKFACAFHSENTYHSTIKLGWKKYLHLQRFHIRIPTLPFAKVLNKLGLNSFYNLFFKKEATKEEIAKLRTDHKDKFQQDFTSSFVQYKNSFNNHYFIQSDDCIFWVKIQAVMLVGLFYAPSDKAFEKAINKIKRKAFFLGINEIQFHVQPTSKMASQLQKIESPQESWLVGYLSFEPDIDINDYFFCFADFDTY